MVQAKKTDARKKEPLKKGPAIDVYRLRWIVSKNIFVFLLGIGTFLSILLWIISFVLFGVTQQFTTTVLLGTLFLYSPLLVYLYLQYSRVQEIEEYFPNFLRDLADAQRAGTTLPRAIYATSNIYYGALSPEVRKMADQISWGIPFEEVFERFKKRINSVLVRRSIDIIIEAHRAGGQITQIFDTVTADTQKIKEVEHERRSTLRVHVYTVYFIYFVFMFIVVILQTLLVPSLPAISNISKIVGGGGQSISEEGFYVYLLHLTVIQGFFIGLIAGEMSEGSLTAGLKHSVILIAVGFLILQSIAAPPDAQSRLVRMMTLVPGGVELDLDLGIYEVRQNMSSTSIVGEVGKIIQSDPSKTYLSQIVAENIIFDDTGCNSCGRATAFVTDDRHGLVVRRPVKLHFALQIKNYAYLISMRTPAQGAAT